MKQILPLAALVVLAACGSTRTSAPAETSLPASTEPPASTVALTTTVPPATTVPPPTTAPPTTTVPPTTAPLAVPGWDAACTEVVGSSVPDDRAPRDFTDLGAAPSLEFVVPDVVTSSGPLESITGTALIPGGLLVGVYPPDSWPSEADIVTSSQLVAVDLDGGLRWRRCFDELETRRFAVAPADLEPEVAWVLSTPFDGPTRIVGVDLATGVEVPFPVDVSALEQRGGGDDRHLVLGPRFGSGPLAADSRFLVVDTLDGSLAEVPVPPEWVGGGGDWMYVAGPADDGDVPVLTTGFPGSPGPMSLYVDGAWTADPALAADLLPVVVTETFGDPAELQLYDASGTLLWAVPDFHSVPREGFHWGIADEVVLAMRCTTFDRDACSGEVGPAGEELAAFDLATGRELWADAELGAAVVIAGDRAIVSLSDTAGAPLGQILVDVRTGERIGPVGDPWPNLSFAQGCCGEDVYVNVQRFGGVVVAFDYERISVWYPAESSVPTVTVDLMG